VVVIKASRKPRMEVKPTEGLQTNLILSKAI
jgi:hypothetical protein